MSNLHVNLDEANKHTPKGFDNAATNTRPWKDESNQSTYTENETLPRALNFVDGTTAPPTTTNGHIYVITGTGTVNAGWGSASFNDWVRFANGFPVSISPVTGYLCYDITASQWMEFDGTTWAAFGGGGVVNTIFTGGTMSAPSTIAMTGNALTFDGGDTTFKGSASSGTTTNFLVQNSASTIFEMYHNKSVIFGGGGVASTGSYNAMFTIRNSSSLSDRGILSLVNASNTPVFNVTNGFAAVNSTSNGISAFRVKSLGPISLHVNDISGSEMFMQYYDSTKGGSITGIGYFGNSLNAAQRQSTAWTVLQESNANGAALEIKQGVDPTGVALKNGTVWYNNAFNLKGAAKIIGRGSTSATTALLVQNALGTDLLEVKDDGTILGNLPNIYGADGTVGSGRVATLTDTLTLSLGSLNNYGLKFREGLTDLGGIVRSGANNIALTLGTGSNITVLRGGGTGFPSIIGGDDPLNIGAATISNRLVLKSTGNIKGLSLEGSTGYHAARLTQHSTTGALIQLGNSTNPVGLGSESLNLTSLIGSVNWIANDSNNLGIGIVGATAKLHVKGTGSTSATTALLVQNSLGIDLLEVKDDGATVLKNQNGTTLFSATNSANFFFNGDVGIYDRLYIEGAGVVTNNLLHLENSTGQAILDITGNGSTILKNNNGTTLFSATNSANFFFNGDVRIFDKAKIEAFSSVAFEVEDTGTSQTAFTVSKTGNVYAKGDVAIGTTSHTAKLHVKSAGSTSATTALLVENSLGTDLLEIKDDASAAFNGNLGLFGTTPIAQPTTAVAASILGTGAGTGLTDLDTFDGYTLQQVVKALRNLGILA